MTQTDPIQAVAEAPCPGGQTPTNLLGFPCVNGAVQDPGGYRACQVCAGTGLRWRHLSTGCLICGAAYGHTPAVDCCQEPHGDLEDRGCHGTGRLSNVTLEEIGDTLRAGHEAVALEYMWHDGIWNLEVSVLPSAGSEWHLLASGGGSTQIEAACAALLASIEEE